MVEHLPGGSYLLYGTACSLSHESTSPRLFANLLYGTDQVRVSVEDQRINIVGEPVTVVAQGHGHPTHEVDLGDHPMVLQVCPPPRRAVDGLRHRSRIRPVRV